MNLLSHVSGKGPKLHASSPTNASSTFKNKREVCREIVVVSAKFFRKSVVLRLFADGMHCCEANASSTPSVAKCGRLSIV